MYPPARLNLYISHAPEDAPYLSNLLKWIRPIEQQNHLRVWYSRPVPSAQPWPFSWRLLFAHIWYPLKKGSPYDPALHREVEEGHIYMFLMSHNSLATQWIDDKEITPAMRRYILHGDNYVRILPVPLSKSMWKDKSRLSGFEPVGSHKFLADADHKEEGYLAIAQHLEAVVQQLQRNWTEKEEINRVIAKTADITRFGNWDVKFPALADNDYATPPFPPESIEPKEFPLPGFLGWMLIGLIWMVTALGFEQCRWRLIRENNTHPKAQPSTIKPVEFIRLPLMPAPNVMPPAKDCDCDEEKNAEK